jgi:hypothetical protein
MINAAAWLVVLGMFAVAVTVLWPVMIAMMAAGNWPEPADTGCWRSGGLEPTTR